MKDTFRIALWMTYAQFKKTNYTSVNIKRFVDTKGVMRSRQSKKGISILGTIWK